MTSTSTNRPEHTQRLTRWEILGAWLHIWTPPRDLPVPPVPWRALTIWGTVGAVVLAVATAVAIPGIDAGKRRGAADRARAASTAEAIERARLRADQRVHVAMAAQGGHLVRRLQDAITTDAKARARAKTINGPVLSTKCTPTSPEVSTFPDSRVYKCFVKTATGLPGQNGEVLGTGYPFVATIYNKERRLAWCKQNPHADEKGSHGDVRVRTSPVCAGKLSEVL
jgi:hypothetical protein